MLDSGLCQTEISRFVDEGSCGNEVHGDNWWSKEYPPHGTRTLKKCVLSSLGMGHDTPNSVLVALIVSTLKNHFHESTVCADCFAMKGRGVRTAFLRDVLLSQTS